jgi:hypothetical protein
MARGIKCRTVRPAPLCHTKTAKSSYIVNNTDYNMCLIFSSRRSVAGYCGHLHELESEFAAFGGGQLLQHVGFVF